MIVPVSVSASIDMSLTNFLSFGSKSTDVWMVKTVIFCILFFSVFGKYLHGRKDRRHWRNPKAPLWCNLNYLYVRAGVTEDFVTEISNEGC